MNPLVFVAVFTGEASVHIVFRCSALGGLLRANRFNQSFCSHLRLKDRLCFFSNSLPGCSVVMFQRRTVS